MVLPAATGSGASLLASVKRGSDRIVVVSAAPLTGPTSLDVMLYVPFVMRVLFATGVLIDTTIWTEPEVPALSVPRFQVTTPAASAPPAVAETEVVPAGAESRRRTPVAFALPMFEYEIV